MGLPGNGKLSGVVRFLLTALPVLVLWTFALLAGARPAMCQELEPRVYSAAPVGTNFVVASSAISKGDVSLDPSLPLSDVHASITTTTLSFTRTFPLAGRTASWSVLVPYVNGRISGAVYGETAAATRDGFPDSRLRFAINVLGRALTPAEFARRKPGATLGVAVTAIVPTGTYDPTRFINIGSNRWSVKPEIGTEIPMGKWFADFSAGVWLFGENRNYFGGQMLRQAALATYQIHAGYSFRSGQWLAVQGGYYAGGATTAGAARPINALSNSRYGLALAQPLGGGVSAKFSWSHWLSGTYGQNFSTIGVALQYVWFDHR